jgi:hypothetical protein
MSVPMAILMTMISDILYTVTFENNSERRLKVTVLINKLIIRFRD